MKIKTRRVGKLSLITITSRDSFGVLYIVLRDGIVMFGAGLGSKKFKGEALFAADDAIHEHDEAYDWCDI
tara:strand:- start:412 stop:621 length:210 start_codon:yes stop_codon:yes gene_type:complete